MLFDKGFEFGPPREKLLSTNAANDQAHVQALIEGSDALADEIKGESDNVTINIKPMTLDQLFGSLLTLKTEDQKALAAARRWQIRNQSVDGLKARTAEIKQERAQERESYKGQLEDQTEEIEELRTEVQRAHRELEYARDEIDLREYGIDDFVDEIQSLQSTVNDGKRGKSGGEKYSRNWLQWQKVCGQQCVNSKRSKHQNIFGWQRNQNTAKRSLTIMRDCEVLSRISPRRLK